MFITNKIIREKKLYLTLLDVIRSPEVLKAITKGLIEEYQKAENKNKLQKKVKEKIE